MITFAAARSFCSICVFQFTIATVDWETQTRTRVSLDDLPGIPEKRRKSDAALSWKKRFFQCSDARFPGCGWLPLASLGAFGMGPGVAHKERASFLRTQRGSRRNARVTNRRKSAAALVALWMVDADRTQEPVGHKMWKDLHAVHFHKCEERAFTSNIGLTLEEIECVWAKCGPAHEITRKELLIACHFAWRCPEQHQGAAIFKCNTRKTHSEKAWKAAVLMSTHGEEMKMDNRLQDLVLLDGPEECMTLCTDSADCMVSKPPDRESQKAHCTFKRRAFAHRCAMAVSRGRGHLCWVSPGDPAGSAADLTINRREGLADKVNFFERMGADGAHKCRRDPVHVTPHRKPRGGELTDEEKAANTRFSAKRVIVENVFSRVKQWSCMRRWRHRRDLHPVIAHFVFQLVQVKNKFRPVRAVADSAARRREVAASWQEAERKGTAPMAPPARSRRRRRRAAAAGGDNADAGDAAEPVRRSARRPRRRRPDLVEQVIGADLANREWEALLLSEAQADERADRAARRAARASNPEMAEELMASGESDAWRS